jgi:hypothetical protein
LFVRFQQEMPDAIKIVKVGETPAQQASSRPKSVRKTMRTYPRGIMKKGGAAPPKGIKGVSDPAKSPPIAAGRKSTLRILTEKGAAKRRETIHKKVKSMPIGAVRETLRRSGLPISEKTPPHIAKEILEGGMEAGMIVSK